MEKALVTGGSGYIASWVIKFLLEQGISVHATVRDLNKKAKYQHLLDIEKETSGKLSFFEADLLESGSFADAMEGVDTVFHMASPFFIDNIKDPQEQLIKPALQGTENVLETVNQTSSVKKVVLTSSVAAVFGDAQDIDTVTDRMFTEKNWNESSSTKHQPYSYSKTVAERKAWEMRKKQDRWDLVVLNPGFVLGPSLTDRKDSTSIRLMTQLGDGTFKMGAPEIYNGIVDVRDVAAAHLQAALLPQASGRHILVSEVLSFPEMGKTLKQRFPKYPFPEKKIPKWLTWLLGPLQGISRSFVQRNIGYPIRFDTRYAKEDLQIDFRPVEETLSDHFQQLIRMKAL